MNVLFYLFSVLSSNVNFESQLNPKYCLTPSWLPYTHFILKIIHTLKTTVPRIPASLRHFHPRTLLGNLNYICLQNLTQLHSVWTNLTQLTANLSHKAQIPCSVIHIIIYYISTTHVIFQFSLWYSKNERFCKQLWIKSKW